MMRSNWAATGVLALVAIGLLTGCGSSTAMGNSGSGGGSGSQTAMSNSSSSMSGSTSSSTAASGSSAMGSATAPQVAKDQVVLANGAFTPASLTVAGGTKITFVFDGMGTDHILFTAPQPLRSPALTHGQSWSYTFTQAGTYRYEAQAMPYIKGRITVQ